MDPITIGLGTKVIETLMPYVAKGAKKMLKAAGKVAVGKIEGLLKTLKTKFEGDESATDMLIEFEKDPVVYKPVLEKVLQKKIDKDNDLAETLHNQIEEIGPIIDIDLDIEDAEGEVIVGEIEEMKKGKAHLKLKAKTTKKKVVGGKFGKVG